MAMEAGPRCGLLSCWGAGITLDGTFQPPEVDWLDPSSSIYWYALGGIFLTNVSDPSGAQWSTQASAS